MKSYIYNILLSLCFISSLLTHEVNAQTCSQYPCFSTIPNIQIHFYDSYGDGWNCNTNCGYLQINFTYEGCGASYPGFGYNLPYGPYAGTNEQMAPGVWRMYYTGYTPYPGEVSYKVCQGGNCTTYPFFYGNQYITILPGCITGCIDNSALNYNPNATLQMNINDCTYDVYGCTDPMALNYNSNATIDDGSCCYVSGCTSPTSSNYNPNACVDDGSCISIYNSTCQSFSLGNDTSICSSTYVLNAPTGFNYQWNTGETSQSITITQSGNYSVVISDSISSTAINASTIDLDGYDGRVIIPHSSSFNLSQISVLLWVYPDGLYYENYLIDKSWDNGGNNSTRNWGIRSNSSGNLEVEININGNYDLWTSSQTLNQSQWNQLALTYDGQNVKLYHDNIEIINHNVSGSLTSSTEDISIGFFPHSNLNQYGYFYDGSIDDVQIWDYALTQQEIQEYMDCKPNGNETGLVGYWNFENGSGNIAYDVVGNNNGNIQGGFNWSSSVPTSQSCQSVCSSTDSINITFNICGCTDSTALNYNPNATQDDGSCIAFVYGCTDSTALNYNPLATVDDGSCVLVVLGCMDSTMFNYSPLANTDDGSCVPYIYGCIDPTMFNYNAIANTSDSSCVPFIYGCTDITMFNYNPNANTDNGSCIPFIYGCTDSIAVNYDSTANTNDGTCTFCYAIADIGLDTIIACDSSVLLSTNAISNGSYIWNSSNIPTSATPSIGDYYQGGVVFWIDPNDNTQGLVCDIGDLGMAGWGCPTTLIAGADGTAIGTGNQNTIDIMNGCSWSIMAAANCYNSNNNGYSDWFLPSKDELNQMYLNKASIDSTSLSNGGGSFNSVYYWTSTEMSFDNAYVQHFLGSNPGHQSNHYKATSTSGSYATNVRSIRHVFPPINTDTINSIMVSTSGWNYVMVTDSLGCTATDSVYVSFQTCIYGCTDPTALNYDSTATIDDGSCTYGCGPVTGVNMTDVIHDRATFNWDDMNSSTCNVDQIRIRYREVGTSAYSTKTMGSPVGNNAPALNTSKLVLNLTASTQYEYDFKIWYQDVGQGTTVVHWHANGSFTTADPCVNATNITATPQSASATEFCWDAPTAPWAFVRLKYRENVPGSSFSNIGGMGVSSPLLCKTKNGITPGLQYRVMWRTWCNPSGGPYRSPVWDGPVIWDQPTSIRLEGGTAITNLEIYPNPSRDIFNITFISNEKQDFEIRIINVIGENIFIESKQQFIGEYTKQISLGEYPKAIYFLEIETDDGVINKKLILQ